MLAHRAPAGAPAATKNSALPPQWALLVILELRPVPLITPKRARPAHRRFLSRASGVPSPKPCCGQQDYPGVSVKWRMAEGDYQRECSGFGTQACGSD